MLRNRGLSYAIISLMKKTNIVVLALVAFLTCSCDETSNGIVGANPKPSLPAGYETHKSALESLLESSSKPAVIKFYAEWCGSCKDYGPSYSAVKSKMSSQVDFFEIDIDKKTNKDLVRELRVARIPETIFVSKNRKNVSRELGALSEEGLKQLIQTKLIK